MRAEERRALERQVQRASEVSNLACRQGANGHCWQRCRPDFTPNSGIAVVKQCMICKTIRREIHDAYGELLAADYEYPVGYLYQRTPDDPRGEPLLPRRAVRKAYDDVVGRTKGLPPVIALGEQSEGKSFAKHFTR